MKRDTGLLSFIYIFPILPLFSYIGTFYQFFPFLGFSAPSILVAHIFRGEASRVFPTLTTKFYLSISYLHSIPLFFISLGNYRVAIMIT